MSDMLRVLLSSPPGMKHPLSTSVSSYCWHCYAERSSGSLLHILSRLLAYDTSFFLLNHCASLRAVGCVPSNL